MNPIFGSFGHGRFAPGTSIGGAFRITRLIARGGMGEVYAARDVSLGRQVAIKTMKVDAVLSPMTRVKMERQFRRDAAATARLNHPNIVTVYQHGVHDECPYIALEYVRGETLESVLEREGRLPDALVCRIAMQIAQALGYAHKRGIIHRDLKPSNVMLTPERRIKVLDFGIAMMTREREALREAFDMDDAELESYLGASATKAGTPLYMAPEQAQGVLQDARADIWSFGVLVFELLTGQRPYTAVGGLDASFRVTWPRGIDICEPMRALVSRCVRVDREVRPQSFEGIVEVLHHIGVTQEHVTFEAPGALRTNLTAPDDVFVGRDDELALMDEVLLELGVPCVEIVGVAGVGKSRLARQWCWRAMQEGDVSEVIYCNLANARQPRDVLAELGAQLGIALDQQDVKLQMGWALSKRPDMVIVFARCDWVLPVLRKFMLHWRLVAPQVRFVFTAQHALGLPESRIVHLDPLGTRREAVELFMARAAERTPGFELARDDLPVVRALVEELDGLPLAIELAAARTKLLSPEQILERMTRRFELLRGEASDTTLRGAMEWAWELLDEPSWGMLAQLSVFAGRFALEDAEGVVELDGEHFVLDVLEDLVDRSLVSFRHGAPRFALLRSVRAFAAQKLEDMGEEDATRMRHAGWFAHVASPQALLRFSTDEDVRLLQAREDLELAKRTVRELGGSEHHGMLQHLTAAVAVVHERLGPHDAYAKLLEGLEGVPDDASGFGHLAYGFIGILARGCDDLLVAQELFERAERAARARGNDVYACVWRAHVGLTLQRRGELDEARAIVAEALETFAAERHIVHEAYWSGALATIARTRGDFAGLDAAVAHGRVDRAHARGLRRGARWVQAQPRALERVRVPPHRVHGLWIDRPRGRAPRRARASEAVVQARRRPRRGDEGRRARGDVARSHGRGDAEFGGA